MQLDKKREKFKTREERLRIRLDQCILDLYGILKKPNGPLIHNPVFNDRSALAARWFDEAEKYKINVSYQRRRYDSLMQIAERVSKEDIAKEVLKGFFRGDVIGEKLPANSYEKAGGKRGLRLAGGPFVEYIA